MGDEQVEEQRRLDGGANINEKDVSGRTPLLRALLRAAGRFCCFSNAEVPATSTFRTRTPSQAKDIPTQSWRCQSSSRKGRDIRRRSTRYEDGPWSRRQLEAQAEEKSPWRRPPGAMDSRKWREYTAEEWEELVCRWEAAPSPPRKWHPSSMAFETEYPAETRANVRI